jgi:hypothetical protein
MVIKTPHALPMFREDPGRKRQREKDRMVSSSGVAMIAIVKEVIYARVEDEDMRASLAVIE